MSKNKRFYIDSIIYDESVKAPYTPMDMSNIKIKPTTFTNEITGAYYEAKLSWWRVSLAILIAVALILMVADFIFGAETVTNYLAEILA